MVCPRFRARGFAPGFAVVCPRFRCLGFDAFFARSDLVWIELTKDVVELAAAIRVQTGLKTPDALQAASCLQLGGDHTFLTGDAGFRRVAGLNTKVLA